MAIKTAIKVGTYYIVVLFAVALAAAETMRPVASGVALDMMPREMPYISLQCLRMAIKIKQRRRCICLSPTPFCLA
jgi:hypothetical protein